MDDIMNALSQAMSDPATAAQVNGLISALSGNPAGNPSGSSGGAGDMGGQGGNAAGQALSFSDTSPDMTKLMQAGTAIMQSGNNDPNIALLTALRPLLKEETQVKADRVVKIFRLLAAYPMLRDSGLF